MKKYLRERKKVCTFASAIENDTVAKQEKFFERFYINKQNVVQASHYKYDVMKKDKPSIRIIKIRYPEQRQCASLWMYKIFYNEEFDPGSG